MEAAGKTWTDVDTACYRQGKKKTWGELLTAETLAMKRWDMKTFIPSFWFLCRRMLPWIRIKKKTKNDYLREWSSSRISDSDFLFFVVLVLNAILYIILVYIFAAKINSRIFEAIVCSPATFENAPVSRPIFWSSLIILDNVFFPVVLPNKKSMLHDESKVEFEMFARV